MSLSQNDCLELAALWLVRSRDKDFTVEDQKMLDAWLGESHANRKAFDEMSEIWEQTGVLEHIFEPGTKDEHHEVEIQSGLKTLISRFLKVAKKAGRKTMITCTAMATLIFFCLPVLKMYFSAPVETFKTFYAYTSATGEQKTVTLSDGSILNMNVSTSLSVCMSKHYRQVKMMGGEVFFEVKPDPDRPFEVQTSSGLVRVLGTGFNIKDRGGRVNVDVDHGKVQVRNVLTASRDMRVRAIILVAGEGVDINASGHLAKLRSSDIKQVLAWQKQQVVFRNTPVDEVLRELGFYHNIKINLAVKELGKRGVTGTFDMRNLEQTLGIIVTATSLKIKKESNGAITLSGEPLVKNRL